MSVSDSAKNAPTPVEELLIVKLAIGLAGALLNPLPVIVAVPPSFKEFSFTELNTGARLSTVSSAPEEF